MSSVKTISKEVQTQIPASASQLTQTIKMINRLSVEKLEAVCSDPSFSNNVIFTNFNPDFQLEEVLEAILDHRRVRAFSRNLA
jgi:hypothetical protein